MPVTVTTFDDAVIDRFTRSGAWGAESLSVLIRGLAEGEHRDQAAYLVDNGQLSWHDYDAAADKVAATLTSIGLEPGAFVGVFLPDTPATHVVYLALERAGLIVVGIGPRSGRHEIGHLLGATQASVLLTPSLVRGQDQGQLFAALAGELPSLARHITIDSIDPVRILVDGRPAPTPPVSGALPVPVGPNNVFMVNSTSGTTGLPKCVQHTQNRWIRFAQHAVRAGELTGEDVLMSALPSPYGFGLWSAHFLPPLLGAPAVLMPRWDASLALQLMRQHRVTVFAGVTTQLMMLLDRLDAGETPPPDLRVIFTGGEAVPYERARRFERRTGSRVLQFYGSNESGALSCTTTRDDTEHRLRTAGRILDEMEVELVDPSSGERVTVPGALGQPVCFGPLASPGYLADEAANAALFDSEGRLRMPDLATISADGYLTVAGRVADIIIRGGMNVSATEVEGALLAHPAVELAAVIGAAHETFGEQVAAFVQLRPGTSLSLDGLREHLNQRGMAKYTWPEQLYVLDEMPRNAGEKISKSALRRRLRPGPAG
jgi:acyl-CoA synthetase